MGADQVKARRAVRSAESPLFLSFGLAMGSVGIGVLLVASARLGTPPILTLLLLAAIALTMRLNTFTILPRIVVSLVYTVQMAAVILLGGVEAAWIAVATFLIAILVRRPVGVTSRVFLAVVSFNLGMEVFMTLAAAGVYRLVLAAAGSLERDRGITLALLSAGGMVAVLALGVTLTVVNEALMTLGSFLRGIPVAVYIAGARKVLLVEAGMFPLGLLLALIGTTAGERGLASLPGREDEFRSCSEAQYASSGRDWPAWLGRSRTCPLPG